MESNVYTELIGRLRGDIQLQLPTGYRLGKVIKTDPITINVAGINLSGDDLMINALLLKHPRNVEMNMITGNLSASVNCSEGSISSISVTSGSINSVATLDYCLTKGDSVLLLPIEDEQRFIILCKVV